MKVDRIKISKVLISTGLLISTGIPFLIFRRIFLPAQVNLFIGILVFISFILLWRELIYFKKDWWSWFFAITICIITLLRKGLIPPPIFKIYDVFFIFVALSFIYCPSRIKELLVFSSCLIAPLSLAGIYGFIPSSSTSQVFILLRLDYNFWIRGNNRKWRA